MPAADAVALPWLLGELFKWSCDLDKARECEITRRTASLALLPYEQWPNTAKEQLAVWVKQLPLARRREKLEANGATPGDQKKRVEAKLKQYEACLDKLLERVRKYTPSDTARMELQRISTSGSELTSNVEVQEVLTRLRPIAEIMLNEDRHHAMHGAVVESSPHEFAKQRISEKCKKPVDDFDNRFDSYCNAVSVGLSYPIDELSNEIARFDEEGFANELLQEIWKWRADGAAERGLPRPASECRKGKTEPILQTVAKTMGLDLPMATAVWLETHPHASLDEVMEKTGKKKSTLYAKRGPWAAVRKILIKQQGSAQDARRKRSSGDITRNLQTGGTEKSREALRTAARPGIINTTDDGDRTIDGIHFDQLPDD